LATNSFISELSLHHPAAEEAMPGMEAASLTALLVLMWNFSMFQYDVLSLKPWLSPTQEAHQNACAK
jgi:hypothetical protein